MGLRLTCYELSVWRFRAGITSGGPPARVGMLGSAGWRSGGPECQVPFWIGTGNRRDLGPDRDLKQARCQGAQRVKSALKISNDSF